MAPARTCFGRLHRSARGAVVGRWLASPPHREELLDPRFRELGISALRALAAPGIFGGQAVVLTVADFGVRR
jgi:hypothetical protein